MMGYFCEDKAGISNKSVRRFYDMSEGEADDFRESLVKLLDDDDCDVIIKDFMDFYAEEFMLKEE